MGNQLKVNRKPTLSYHDVKIPERANLLFECLHNACQQLASQIVGIVAVSARWNLLLSTTACNIWGYASWQVAILQETRVEACRCGRAMKIALPSQLDSTWWACVYVSLLMRVCVARLLAPG